MYNLGNTFYWSNSQYATITQIQTRLLGNTNWGGTTIHNGGNSWNNAILWGTHQWRLRSRCYATTSNNWTDWSPIMTTNFIPKPLSFEFEQNNNFYPNPANNVVYYNGKITIMDLQGRTLVEGENEVDIQNLANGIYILNGSKLVVQH
jgi:hypothetical protein